VAYEDLLKSVEESAHDKEAELRKREKEAVGEIQARAKKQAGEIRQAQIDETERSIATERNKLLYLTKAENKEDLIRVREVAFKEAFAQAQAQLGSLRSDPKYPEVFTRLLQEAAASMGGGSFVFHIDPRDEALCTKVLASLGLSAPVIRTDITTAGGVVAGLPDGSVVVSNTVESRLERIKELKRNEIHAILSGA